MKFFKAQPSVPARETEAVAPEGEKVTEIKRYQEAWRNYRILSGRYWIVFLTYIPGVLLLGGLLSFTVNDNLAHGIVAFSWMALWIVAGQGYINFCCPRCGEKFFRRKGFSTVFTARCLNCGLPTYSVDSSGTRQDDGIW